MNVVLSISLLGVLVDHAVLLPMVFRVPPWSSLGIVLILFLALLVGAVLGLMGMRVWGYWLAYALVPVSTVLPGVSLVPFVPDLIPGLEWRTRAVVVLNGAFLVAALISHRVHRRGTERGGEWLYRGPALGQP